MESRVLALDLKGSQMMGWACPRPLKALHTLSENRD